MKYLALVPMAAGLLLLNNIDAMARVLNEKVAEVIQQPTALATTTVSKMEVKLIRFHRKKTKIMTHVISCRNFRVGQKCIIAVSC